MIMNRIINKSQAIRATVWVFVLCAVFSLWPLRLVQETVVSGSRAQAVMESEAITSDYVVQQMFIAQYDRLKNIDIYFTQGTVGEKFNFVLYDARMNIIMQQVIDTEGMEAIPGFCTVQVNIDAEVGREYYYLIQGLDSSFRVAYENTEDSGNIYNGTLYYGNVEDTEHCIITKYEYSMPLRKGKTLLCAAVLILAGFLVSRITYTYYGKKQERDHLVTVEKTVKTVCNPLIVIGAAVAMTAVWPCGLFTPRQDTVTAVFLIAGIVLAAAVLFYAVNHDRTGFMSDRTVLGAVCGNWRNYLQSFFFAGAIWACCNYVNGLYEMYHTIAYRQQLIFLALAVIVTYRGRDIFNWVNLIYAVAAATVGLRYYNGLLADMEAPGDMEILALKLTVWAGVLAGVVIIGTIRFLVRRQIRDISVWYWIPVAVFFVLIIWRRNTRGWPVYLVCCFALFYLNMAAWDGKAMLLGNLCNGILLHFGAMVIYCLLHRPYMFFIYSRYPFTFHTVTITGVYLTLVVCAALVKFLDAYRRNRRLAYVYKELLLLGVASVYLLLTMSRTGYIAAVVVAAVVIPIVCFSFAHRWRSMIRAVGMILAAFVLCFPITFTAQRMLPALVARPVVFEIEELPSEIMHGRDMDSFYYMTPMRFIQVFQMKILGIPEEESLVAPFYMNGNEEIEFLDESAGYVNTPDSMLACADPILLASTENVPVEIPAQCEEAEGDAVRSYANGRMDIFKLYLSRLNRNGHDDMDIMEPDGTYTVHAHNIYLQVAYDHGIPVGIAFILLGVCTLVQSAVYYHKHKEDRVCASLPIAILVMFAVAGLTEWIFHPCNPTTCSLLVAMTPLLFDRQRTTQNHE